MTLSGTMHQSCQPQISPATYALSDSWDSPPYNTYHSTHRYHRPWSGSQSWRGSVPIAQAPLPRGYGQASKAVWNGTYSTQHVYGPPPSSPPPPPPPPPSPPTHHYAYNGVRAGYSTASYAQGPPPAYVSSRQPSPKDVPPGYHYQMGSSPVGDLKQAKKQQYN